MSDVDSSLVRPLFEGLLDVVGDVHGEIEPLRELLAHLGYDAAGQHPKDRRLVFVGDLGDRGPDSPAVIELVRGLVGKGRAQCVLGNHELNLLRGKPKHGNEWFIDPAHARAQPGGEFDHCRVAPEAMKPVWLEFFSQLPVALERTDLRVVHAAWIAKDIDTLRGERGGILEAYARLEPTASSETEAWRRAADEEKARWHTPLHDEQATVPLLQAIARYDELQQMGNPVRVLTSGVERAATRPFWSSGKWRMVDRVRWWEDYRDEPAVIVGHYWRQAQRVTASAHVVAKPSLFDGVAAGDWLGPRRNVYCVDFSIGGRSGERKAGASQYNTHLAAVRWPEREIWFETGRVA